MKYIYLTLSALIMSVSISSSAFAATSGKLVNYPVGTCREIGGGLWQQMPDGTWADPNDRLNSCRFDNGQSWMNSQYNNPWMRAGYDQSGGLGDMSQSEWFQRCIMTQTLMPIPECQGINGWYGNSGQDSTFDNLAWYPRAGREASNFFYADDNQVIQAEIPGKPNGLSSALFGIALGFVFNQLTN